MSNHFLKSEFSMLPSPSFNQHDFNKERKTPTINPLLTTHSRSYFMMKWWNYFGVPAFPQMHFVSFDAGFSSSQTD